MLFRAILALCLAAITFTPGITARESGPPLPLQLDGFPLAMSPDGASVAGVDRSGDQFCIWEIATLDAACDGELPAPVEARSVTWAPDSSAVAFSLGAANRLVDSDIYIFNAETTTLTDLTDDTGADEVSFLSPQVEPVAIDVFPAWSPDGSTLLFARTMWHDVAAPGVALMTVPREGGDPEVVAKLVDLAPLAIAGPMTWREDGRVLLATRHPNPANPANAIRLLQPDGTMTTLVDGSSDGPITDPVIASMSGDGTAVSAWSRLDFHESLWAEGTPIFFRVDVERGSATPWTDVPGVDLPDDARLLAPPVFGPNDSVAFLWRVRGGDMGISVLDASGAFRDVSEVSYIPRGFTPRNINGLSPTLQWADDGTLLVILATGGTIIPLGHEGATPAATPAG